MYKKSNKTDKNHKNMNIKKNYWAKPPNSTLICLHFYLKLSILALRNIAVFWFKAQPMDRIAMVLNEQLC